LPVWADVLRPAQVSRKIENGQYQGVPALARNAWRKALALQVLMGRAGRLGVFPCPFAPLGGLSVPCPFLGLTFGLLALNTLAQSVPLGWGEAFRALAAPAHAATCAPVTSNTSRRRVLVQAIPARPLPRFVSGEAHPVQFAVWGYALAWGKLDAASGKGVKELRDNVSHDGHPARGARVQQKASQREVLRLCKSM
jgi:hypothetical protein